MNQNKNNNQQGKQNYDVFTPEDKDPLGVFTDAPPMTSDYPDWNTVQNIGNTQQSQSYQKPQQMSMNSNQQPQTINNYPMYNPNMAMSYNSQQGQQGMNYQNPMYPQQQPIYQQSMYQQPMYQQPMYQQSNANYKYVPDSSIYQQPPNGYLPPNQTVITQQVPVVSPYRGKASCGQCRGTGINLTGTRCSCTIDNDSDMMLGVGLGMGMLGFGHRHYHHGYGLGFGHHHHCHW